MIGTAQVGRIGRAGLAAVHGQPVPDPIGTGSHRLDEGHRAGAVNEQCPGRWFGVPRLLIRRLCHVE
jgi:hypothetical protein